MLHHLDGLQSLTVWRNIMTVSSGSCRLLTVLFLNCTTSFKISLTIYQLTSGHSISEDFTVQQDNEPIHNSSKFQPSVSYCMMMLLEPIQHQLTEWSASDKQKVSGIDCGFIMAQSQHLMGLRKFTTHQDLCFLHVELLPLSLSNTFTNHNFFH
jgi:hypothetical protein